jgi:hypothetical protein
MSDNNKDYDLAATPDCDACHDKCARRGAPAAKGLLMFGRSSAKANWAEIVAWRS